MEKIAVRIWTLACNIQRFRRWVEAGIIEKLFRELHVQNVIKKNPEALFLDSRSVKVHPDACGALKKTENKPLDVPRVD